MISPTKWSKFRKQSVTFIHSSSQPHLQQSSNIESAFCFHLNPKAQFLCFSSTNPNKNPALQITPASTQVKGPESTKNPQIHNNLFHNQFINLQFQPLHHNLKTKQPQLDPYLKPLPPKPSLFLPIQIAHHTKHRQKKPSQKQRNTGIRYNRDEKKARSAYREVGIARQAAGV